MEPCTLLLLLLLQNSLGCVAYGGDSGRRSGDGSGNESCKGSGSAGRTVAKTCTSAQRISNRQYIPGVYTHGSNAGAMQKETRYASCVIAQRMQKETICSCCVDAHKECKDNEKTDEISTEEELPAICYS